MESDRINLVIINEFINEKKSKVIDLEIAKHKIEIELKEEWSILDRAMQNAGVLKGSIYSERFMICNEDDMAWDGRTWIEVTGEGVIRYTKDDLPLNFYGNTNIGCSLDMGNSDPRYWKYKDSDGDTVYVVTRAK